MGLLFHTLDTLRLMLPDHGFAAYALEPGGPVTVEILTPDGSVFSAKADTEIGAIAKLFPVEPEREQELQPAAPAPQVTPAVPLAAPDAEPATDPPIPYYFE